MAHFVSLYNLAHQILTAHRESDMGKLSLHSGKSDTEAHTILRQAILQATMPGERGDMAWGAVRVFMRNLVNRAFAPISGAEMFNLLRNVEEATDQSDFGQRMEVLSAEVAQRSAALASSLDTLRTVEPVSGQSYVEWLMQKAFYYAALPVEQLDADRVVADVRVIASDAHTKIPQVGVALAANLLADLGAPALAKPDKHVLLTILSLMPAGTRPDPEACIRKVIEVAKQEAPELTRDNEYQWLKNGLYPRHFDRLIYLIGSDNYLLNGTQNKRWAPLRRQLMCDALTVGGEDGGGIAEGRAISPVRPRPPRNLGPVLRDEAGEQKQNESVGGRINVNAELTFYDLLEGDEPARRFIDRLIELATGEGCEVHYAFANGADIRVRAFREHHNPKKQNVLVLRWLRQKRGFATQLFAQANDCLDHGLRTAKPQPRTSSPLPTKAFVDPSNEAQAIAFGSAALRSIRDFCNGRPS